MAQTLEQRVQALEDRVAIKHLVDYFSILADEKKGHEQEALFTPDATVTSINERVGSVFKAKGRQEIGNAFQNLLDRQEVYVKVDNTWYIKDRTSHFMWQESEDIK